MKRYILFLIVFLLSACQSAPQVTVTSEVTVTLPPTETPIPTPTLNPQFAALQEKIASSGNRFTLNAADGLVYDGAEPVPGLNVAPDGTMTLTVNGETVTLDPADVTFDDEKGISIEGYVLDEQGLWVEKVVKEMKEIPLCDTMYDVLTPANKLNPEHMVEFKDLQAIANWVQSQLTADMFNPDKILMFDEIGMRVAESTLGDHLYPDPFAAGGAPHFTEHDAPLYKNNPWCASTMIDGKPNLAFFVPQYIPGVEPTELPVMTGVYELPEGYRGAWPRGIEFYLERMKMVPWVVDEQSIEVATKFVNPTTGELFTKSEVEAIFRQMEAGDFSKTNGLVLRTVIVDNDKDWLE